MDHLMLLGGQFLQARSRAEFEPRCTSVAERSQRFWDDLDQIGCGVFDAYGFAAQLVAGLVLIGMVFGILSLAGSSAEEMPAAACFECATVAQ